MTKDNSLSAISFGARFGRLVRSYRDDLGLSVRDLAIQVWNDEGRKASISRLENGHIGNPAARTVQSLCLALDIPQDEIDQLREPMMGLNSQLESLSSARRDQLEALASRFEIDRVFMRSDTELRGLLDNKALEYRDYKRRLDEMDVHLRELADLKAAAHEAAAQLDFAGYETLLRQVDESYSEMAVRAKEARARNALLRDRVDEAFAGFISAAETWRNIDVGRAAESRLDYHRALYEHGLRHGGDGLARSAEILGPALQIDHGQAPLRARILQNLANAFANMATRSEAVDSVELLDKAINAFKEAASLVSLEGNGDIWGMVQQNLGAALLLRAKQSKDATEHNTVLASAINAYNAALRLRPRESKPFEWAMTTQNMAVALLERGSATSGLPGIDLLKQAALLFEDTLGVRTREKTPFEWALTQENLGIVARVLAARSEPVTAAHFLASAARHVAAALEVYESEGDAYFHAKASELSNEIGRAQDELRQLAFPPVSNPV
ncbi:MAG: helix-turn-helix domain-containing protein [Loktanella sp.]|nr:helix-turn-helix domain-containing protein [Loktanella sp.]